MMRKMLRCYECVNNDCVADDQSGDPSICNDAIMCLKWTMRYSDGSTRVGRGCISDDVVPAYACSKPSMNMNTECCREDLCNGGHFPTLPGNTLSGASEIHCPLVICLAMILPLSLIVYGIILFHRKRRRRENRSTTARSALNVIGVPLMRTISSPKRNTDCPKIKSLTSGSSSDKRLFDQISRQVLLGACLSNDDNIGCFGPQIWRGKRMSVDVIVKIYSARDEDLWTREIEVYSQLLPSSYDILGFEGSDACRRINDIDFWIITRYHPLGSLHDYLAKLPQPLDNHEMTSICLSIVNGLFYLHTKIYGTPVKPAMAHCNLKTKAIFLKHNGACVIGDLAHTVTQDNLDSDKYDTKKLCSRYMSPEFLENTFDPQCLKDFLRSDMYNLGLVFWEVCRRCASNGVSLNHALPYSEWLVLEEDQHPTREEMRKLVVVDQCRPPIPSHWNHDPTLSGMGAMMRDCWQTDATARLPILKVKKRLVKLASNNADVDTLATGLRRT